MNSVKAKDEYFCGKDWTVSRALKGLTKFAFGRTRFQGGFYARIVMSTHPQQLDLPDERAGRHCVSGSYRGVMPSQMSRMTMRP